MVWFCDGELRSPGTVRVKSSIPGSGEVHWANRSVHGKVVKPGLRHWTDIPVEVEDHKCVGRLQSRERRGQVDYLAVHWYRAVAWTW